MKHGKRAGVMGRFRAGTAAAVAERAAHEAQLEAVGTEVGEALVQGRQVLTHQSVSSLSRWGYEISDPAGK